MSKSSKGFTLIEILIVVGIIAILASIVIIAVNPARQFAQARNAQRWSNVNAILNGVHQNMVDNGVFTCAAGALPTTTDATLASSGGYDICDCITPTYIAEMPYDPQNGSFTDCSTYDSDYTILETSGGRITITAPSAELTETIKVTR